MAIFLFELNTSSFNFISLLHYTTRGIILSCSMVKKWGLGPHLL
jgi:hypothetical protein